MSEKNFQALSCEEVEERHWADLYVLGRLSPEEVEAFEDHYMLCETCVAAVERAELMIKGFKQLGAVGASEIPLATPDPVRSSEKVISLDDVRRNRSVPPRLRQLGGLLAAAFLGAILTLPLRWESPGSSLPSVVTVHHLQAVRSADDEPTHRVEPGQNAVLLALEPAPPFLERYRVSLRQRTEAEDLVTIWQSEDLGLGERETVHVRLPKALAEGAYLLLLEADDSGRWVEAGHFMFQIE